MENDNLPLGFGFALARDEEAMKAYSKLSETEKNEIIQKAQNAASKSEMQSVLKDLTTKW